MGRVTGVDVHYDHTRTPGIVDVFVQLVRRQRGDRLLYASVRRWQGAIIISREHRSQAVHGQYVGVVSQLEVGEILLPPDHARTSRVRRLDHDHHVAGLHAIGVAEATVLHNARQVLRDEVGYIDLHANRRVEHVSGEHE